jgi:hypothetical protein
MRSPCRTQGPQIQPTLPRPAIASLKVKPLQSRIGHMHPHSHAAYSCAALPVVVRGGGRFSELAIRHASNRRFFVLF